MDVNDRQGLMDALLVERFGTTTPEWHPTAAEREDAAKVQAHALRLVVDNEILSYQESHMGDACPRWRKETG